MKQTDELKTAIDGGFNPGTFPEAVKAAIDADQLLMDIAVVTATQGKKEATLQYVKLIPTGPEWLMGALALMGGSQEKVAATFSYAYDLGVRQSHRPTLTAQLEGPVKVLIRTAKDLVAAGLADNFTEALDGVLEGRRKKGLDVPTSEEISAALAKK